MSSHTAHPARDTGTVCSSRVSPRPLPVPSLETPHPLSGRMEAGRAGPHSCVQVAAPFPRWWWAEMPMLGVVRTVPQGPTHTQPSPACRPRAQPVLSLGSHLAACLLGALRMVLRIRAERRQPTLDGVCFTHLHQLPGQTCRCLPRPLSWLHPRERGCFQLRWSCPAHRCPCRGLGLCPLPISDPPGEQPRGWQGAGPRDVCTWIC